MPSIEAGMLLMMNDARVDVWPSILGACIYVRMRSSHNDGVDLSDKINRKIEELVEGDGWTAASVINALFDWMEAHE